MVVKKWHWTPCIIFTKSPRQLLSKLFSLCGLLFAFLAIYQVFYYFYSESYVWQCTTMADWVRPVYRRSCEIKDYHSSLQRQHRRTESKTNEKIALVMLYNDKDGTWDHELMTRVIQNREKYARLHGYRVVLANDALDASRPAAWSKLKAVDQHLKSFDYVMYVDMDVVIMNMEVPIENFLDPLLDKDFIMTEDWNGPNTGVWIVRQSNWSHWFLQTAWNQSQLVSGNVRGTAYPFEYEQRAVHYMLGSVIWNRRGLPAFPGNVTDIRSHFLLLPQCAMNSYVMHPFYWYGDREAATYVHGDFLVHFAGKKGVIKSNLMKHYLSVAERS
jgi:hypothetical protein